MKKIKAGESLTITVRVSDDTTVDDVVNAVKERFSGIEIVPDVSNEFERALRDVFVDVCVEQYSHSARDLAEAHAPNLLEHAKTQLLRSGELLTQEHHQKLMDALSEEYEKNAPRWRRIRKGERLPCEAYLSCLAVEYQHGKMIAKSLVPSVAGVIVGQDTWYLPVEDVFTNMKLEDKKL